MTTQTDHDQVNTVRLRGRLFSEPSERDLASGSSVLTFRLVVERSTSPMTTALKQTSDWVDCVVWGGRVKRHAAGWRVGDLVEVDGALRRRFFRVNARTTTRVEVEVLTGRLLSRGQ